MASEIVCRLEESVGLVRNVISHEKTERGYVDGCFDLCHSGHFNAIRQASKVVHTLVIGTNSDEEI